MYKFMIIDRVLNKYTQCEATLQVNEYLLRDGRF